MTGTLDTLIRSFPYAESALRESTAQITDEGQSIEFSAFCQAGSGLICHEFNLSVDPESWAWHRLYGDPLEFRLAELPLAEPVMFNPHD